jgi:prefoldin subunit 5
MNDDYETVVSWIAERAPTEVYAALVRLRLNDHTSETQKRMGEVIREDSKQIGELQAEVERLRATPNRENPELRQRMVGLAKAIDEEMQPGAREFALAAVSDLIDERDALYRKQDELEAEIERLRAYSEAMEHEVTENAAEVERLQEIVRVGFAAQERADYEAIEMLKAEVERLRAALNRAGDRLAQVQPGVTEAWAYEIVPKAEQEIADALAEEKE